MPHLAKRLVIAAGLFLALGSTAAHAQQMATLLTLPIRNGALKLPMEGFHVTEMSAKARGFEMGARGHNAGNMTVLAFLFVAPHKGSTSATCRNQELEQRKKSVNSLKVVDLPIAGDSLRSKLIYPNGFVSILRFWGADDECVVAEAYPDKGTSLDETAAETWLSKNTFDQTYVPSVMDKILYATILYNHHSFAASAPMYQLALDAMSPTDDPKWRRVATDNMGMALGMSGDVDASRAVFEKATVTDPEYPLNYYNLACADAEQGKASAARTHLEKAFSLRENALPGEKFPDPTTDDSLRKLQHDEAFWSLAKNISAQLR